MSDHNEPTDGNLRILTEEEIELYLAGDDKKVTKLILTYLNMIVIVLVRHVNKEDKVLDALGGEEKVMERRTWIEARMVRQDKIDKLITKVIEGSAVWAVLGILGILVYSLGLYIKDFLHMKGH